MMLAALLFVVACIGLACAWMVYRANPTRWDNRLFGVIGVVDAIESAIRAVSVAQGYALSDSTVNRVCAVTAVLLGYLTFEFGWSFPNGRRPPRWLRVLVGGAAVAILGLLFTPRWDIAQRLMNLVFFAPLFVLVLIVMVRKARRLSGREALPVRLVLLALILRWAVALFTYAVARNISDRAFELALLVEATVVVLASFVLVSYAVLLGNLFSVRGIAAEVIFYTTCALTVAATTVAALEAVLAWAPGPTSLRALLAAVALLPLGMFGAIRHFRGHLESMLGPLDPRRALRTSVVERVLRSGENSADAAALLGEACAALREITDGAEIRLLAAPGKRLPAISGVLTADEAARLRVEDHEAREGQLLVGVRAGGKLYGALALVGGRLDHDTLIAAKTICGHIAVRIENHVLFAELEESRRLAALGSFAAAIAHDIRTPLASVQMNVQILRGKSQLPSEDIEHFDIALAELRRLNDNISELLDYAKPVRLQAESLELREVADDAARGIASVLAERGVALRVELPDGLPAVRADAGRLRQVLVNLLDNAARASTRGAAVTLRGQPSEGGRVAVEVADDGKGIEAIDLPRIFEPFFTTRADGTGLGLAIVDKLVRAHEGEVRVRSTPGKGSSFTVLLPAAG